MTQTASQAEPASDFGLVRVTVVAKDHRADLALPGAIRIVELLPEICRVLGVLDAATVYAGYHLVAADGRRLVGEVGLTMQGVEDGQVLTVISGADEEPPRVYDDIVEAMSDAVEATSHPWDPAAGRRTALGAGALLLGLAGVALVLQRPDAVAGAAPGVAALLLVAAATVLSRVRHEHAAAVVLAWAGVYLGAICGATVIAPTGPLLGLPVVLVGAGGCVIGLLGVVGLAEHRSAVLPAVLAGALFGGCGAVVAQVPRFTPAAVYTVMLVAVVLVGSAVPWIALGAGGTRAEQLHTDADITADPSPIDAHQIADDARFGHELLLAVTAGVGLVLVLAGPITVHLGLSGALVPVLGAGALMLRTRQYRVGSEVGAGMVAGVLALASVAVGIVVEQPAWRPVLAVVLAVVVAVLLLSTLVPGRPSVRRGRLGDVAEMVALIAMVPLTVVAIGLVGGGMGLG